MGRKAEKKEERIEQGSLLEVLIRQERDKLVNSFRSEEAQEQAGAMFDAYIAAGGSLDPSHLEGMRQIILDANPLESGESPLVQGQLMVRREIERIEGKMPPLPRRGRASSDKATGEFSEEEELLARFSKSLKPPRVPMLVTQPEKKAAKSGINLLNTFPLTGWLKKKGA